MSTNYYIIPRTASGAPASALIADYYSLSYMSAVNDVGMAALTLPDTHPACSTLYGDKSQIDIYRENSAFGLPATLVWTGLMRRDITQFSRAGYATFYAEDLNSLLKWRQIAYYSGIADISEFTNRTSETILKNLVYFNAGAGATVAPYGRFIAGVIPQLAVDTDQLRGATKSWSCQPSDNLLDTLQKIVAAGAGGDFNVRKVADLNWAFEFYPGQLGTDRTASVLFAVTRGNMDKPRREYNRTAEKTVAFVGGEGKGKDLVFVTRTGATYSLPSNNPSNHHEAWVSATGFKSVKALEAVGDQMLYAARARRAFSFEPLQTQSSFFGVHYFLGDKVSADIFGATTTHKIIKATVSHSPGEGTNGDKDEVVQLVCAEV